MLETDAAQSRGFGYALWQQEPNKKWKLLQCGSRCLAPAESRYSATEVELLAVTWAVKKCKLFLRGAKFDLVVDHNHVRFDYGVLEGYTVLDLGAQTVNLDMLTDLEKHTGRRLRLDAVASATLGIGKTAVGTDALKWWQQYKASGEPEPFLKIAEYCAYDVKVAKCVYEYGVKSGHVKYADNSGNEQVVAVD